MGDSKSLKVKDKDQGSNKKVESGMTLGHPGPPFLSTELFLKYLFDHFSKTYS